MPSLNEISHEAYNGVCEAYSMVRDCFQGPLAIKKAGVKYLPQLSGQTEADYDNYKRRALFFPITGETVSSLIGFATSKEPTLKYPDSMKSYFMDDQGSHQFSEMYVQFLQELLLMGRYINLIDAPIIGAPLPRIVPYTAENLINWLVDSETGKLMWALLKEYVWVPDEHVRFKTVQVCRYRLLELVAGTYKVSVLNEDMKQVGDTVIPTFRGKVLDFIPLIVTGASGVHFDIDQPPMLNICTINISHYMNSADLEWGRHFTGLPTPVVKGVESNSVLRIGGTAAWVLPNPEADAKFLEFLGQGLGSLENAMKEKISLMATMSARLVDTSTKGSEAAETVRLRYASETASLKRIVLAANSGLNLIYSTISSIMGFDQPMISLNKEILTVKLTAGELRELFTAYLNGSLSKESLIYNLRKNELLDPNRTNDEELSSLMSPQEIAALKKPAASPTTTP